MDAAGKQARARRLWRGTAVILLAPPLGGLVVLPFLLIAFPAGEGGVWAALSGLAGVVLTFAWLGGLLPAIAADQLWSFFGADRMPANRAFVVTLAIGFSCGALLTVPSLSLLFDPTKLGPWSHPMFGLAGAIALAATALPFRTGRG